MTSRQQALYDAAKEKHGEIFPCGGRESWDECFTDSHRGLMIWFDYGAVLHGKHRSSGVLTERELNRGLNKAPTENIAMLMLNPGDVAQSPGSREKKERSGH